VKSETEDLIMRKPVKPEVGIVMGSDSDWPLLEDTAKILREFGIVFEVHVISAHRTPKRAAAYAERAARRGLQALIAAAGGAAHLAGTLAAHTTLPVIGVPVKGGALDGLDALLSTVQMPAGVPVATVALGRSGAVNAALFAVQLLALSRPDLARKLAAYKKTLQQKVEKSDARIQTELKKIAP
jgi:phosphoribosylaminoimidazole carboxylase PurE protein